MSAGWSFSVAVALVTVAAACGTGPHAADKPASPEQAVRAHIAAAQAGDAAALRRDACGPLADAMSAHSDAEVRDEFRHAYDLGPDHFATAQHTVTGYYTGVIDLDISFITEDHDGWKVCEIRRGNGVFGPLPGPFGT